MKFLIIFLTTFFSFLVLDISNYNFVLFRSLVSLIIIFAVGVSLIKNPSFRLNRYSVILFLLALLNLLFFSPKLDSLNVLLFFGMIPFLKPASFFLAKTDKFRNYFLISFFCLLGLIGFLFLEEGAFLNIQRRFVGFSGSGTTFSTYLLSLFTIYLFLAKGTKLKLIIIIITGFLVYISQTRISFLLLILILTIYYKRNFFTEKLNFFFITILLFSISFYPAIIFAQSFVDLDLTDRYEETDYSTYTRISYYQNQVKAIKDQEIFSLFFGNGIDQAKEVGSNSLGREVDQHNDFFTLLYDYGLIFSILFLSMLWKIIQNPLVLCICSIYLFSFYHNMIFDIFLIFLIFLSSEIEFEDSNFNGYAPLENNH